MRFLTAGLALALASALSAQETGKITGAIHCDGTGNLVAVWAVTADCRRSHRTTDFERSRFAFEALPPGLYRLVGYCDAAFALPTADIRVEAGQTVDLDLAMRMQSNGSGDIAEGVAPFNARIVDGKGRPIAGAFVRGEGVQLWPASEATSGADGRFGFCAARPGGLRLAIQHTNFHPRTVKLSVGILNYSNGQLEIKLRQR
jgi:hypothetical protein